MPFISSPSLITSSAQVSPNSINTADIQDNAITLGKMAGGTDGTIIVMDANGNPVALAVGTSGEFLQTQGADAAPIWAPAVADWEQLGETTLSSDNATISVASFAARKDLKVTMWLEGRDAVGVPQVRFNTDSGSNYGLFESRDGATWAALDAADNIDITSDGGTEVRAAFCTMWIHNEKTGHRKFGHFHYGLSSATGPSAPEKVVEGYFVWDNTDAQITTITLTSSANKFLSGCRMTVYGKKD